VVGALRHSKPNTEHQPHNDPYIPTSPSSSMYNTHNTSSGSPLTKNLLRPKKKTSSPIHKKTGLQGVKVFGNTGNMMRPTLSTQTSSTEGRILRNTISSSRANIPKQTFVFTTPSKARRTPPPKQHQQRPRTKDENKENSVISQRSRNTASTEKKNPPIVQKRPALKEIKINELGKTTVEVSTTRVGQEEQREDFGDGVGDSIVWRHQFPREPIR
jgi:hypothetical protein